MARKPFAVNAAVREKVRYLAGLGVPQEDIAKMVGCSPKTLRKRLRDELDRGVAEANATVSGFLMAAAKAGNVTAQIFWLKTRAHWRETGASNAPVHDGNSEPNLPPLLILPDNHRDPGLTQALQYAQEQCFAPSKQPAPKLST